MSTFIRVHVRKYAPDFIDTLILCAWFCHFCEYWWDDKWQNKRETEIIATRLYSESRRNSPYMDLRRSASLNIVEWLYQHLQYLGYKDININRKILGQNIRNPPYWIWLDSGRGVFSAQKQFPRACSVADADFRTQPGSSNRRRKKPPKNIMWAYSFAVTI